MTAEEWEKVLLKATERAKEKVASIAQEGRRGVRVGVGASGDKTLLADRAAEEEVLAALEGRGGVKVLSEEAGLVGDLGARTMAVLDPVDGSSNYEVGIPFYCTSVALSDGDSLDGVFLGVVRDLVTGDVYVGKRGKGATKNGKPIRTKQGVRLAEAVVGLDVSGGRAEVVRRLAPLVGSVKRQVHLGANALEMCYLADGRFDAFVDIRGRVRIVDFAAAFLIAEEAGAVFTDAEGKPLRPKFDLENRFAFVGSSNQGLHKEILRLVSASAGKG